MLDFSFLIPILISISALLLSLYREFKGPDISLLNEPTFKLTDRSFVPSQGYIQRWFRLSETSLVFANYGEKGGTILDVKIDFTPIKAFEGFFQDPTFNPLDSPIIIREGENHTIKFRHDLQTIDWKNFALTKILHSNQNVEKAVDEAIAQGKDVFQRFCSLLSEKEELGEISCVVSLTVGRVWPKVKDKSFFEKIKVKNEYDKTIDLLRECLKNWDQLSPTKAELIREFFTIPRDLMSELEANLQILKNEVSEETVGQSRLRRDRWNNWIRARYDGIRWFLIDREKNLRESLERLYKQILSYDGKIEQLLYLGGSRTKEDFEPVNQERDKLHKDINKMLKKLKTILHPKKKEDR